MNDEPLLMRRHILLATAFLAAIFVMPAGPVRAAAPEAQQTAQQQATELDAWTAARRMGVGINIGNTLENTTTWETGWGNPPITKDHIQLLAGLGFKVVRLPVAWDTYAHDGRIDAKKMAHVAEVVDWITSAGMFCVLNIHWDGGWIDSDDKKRFAKTFHTFSPEAERKYQSYWSQIATYFANRDEHLVFESLNEESNFDGAGSQKKAYETLGHVNQLFIDTVRASGGNNSKRLLIIAGYNTDIEKTASPDFAIPHDAVPHKLLLSVHYYTPWPFAGMTHDESWGKMRMTWGTPEDVAELGRNFDKMEAFSRKNDIPVFVGEFGVDVRKDPDSRLRWMTAVAQGALARKMVPVLWEIGQEITRKPPIDVSPYMGAFLVDMKLIDPKQAEAPSQ
jgi:endoglucanase